MVGVGRLRQRDRESHGESSGARDEQDATRGLSGAFNDQPQRRIRCELIADHLTPRRPF